MKNVKVIFSRALPRFISDGGGIRASKRAIYHSVRTITDIVTGGVKETARKKE